tara:strand:- start:1636 stop:2478 length:843 start_codon:yes stop_codon:yes gene_type:complete
MNKYLVIGNPIEHSQSPLLHNYWFNKYKISNSFYEKRKVDKVDLRKIVEQVQKGDIKGVNITVPFKREIFDYIDECPQEVRLTKSVNTLVKENGKVVGYNTDQGGFDISLRKHNWKSKGKKILILGAGGVTPSILASFMKLDGPNKVYLCNRTQTKAEELKKLWDKNVNLLSMKNKTIEIVDWGQQIEICDLIINTTSVGLSKDENINLDFSNYDNNKNALFYDLIYNPEETKFLEEAKKRGNKTMNGKMMFLWQAHLAFKLWTGVSPEINDETISLLDQ